MRILLIADPHIPIPPNHYGGAERIVSLFGSEFARLGHRVDLIAGNGSNSFGGNLYYHKAPTSSYPSRAYRKVAFQIQSLLASIKCDVIYNYGRFDYLEILLKVKKPILHCFQNQIDQAQIDFAENRIKENVFFHCISENQRSHALISTPSVVIPNPINTETFQFGLGKGGYLAFLGRLTYNKGVDIAIKSAIKSGKKLIIAGNIPNETGAKDYFRKEIKPFLDDDLISWIGPVNDSQKQKLLANASALLFPIRWDEPFGIVMAESLACGTPVIASSRASAKEVINNGKTGFLCDSSSSEPNIDSFVKAIKNISKIDRNSCRTIAENKYEIKMLAPKVLEIMEGLI